MTTAIEFASQLRPGSQDAPIIAAVRRGELDADSKPSIPIKIGDKLEILVAPDVVSIHGLRVPMTPWAAQAVADEVGAILPSRKLSNEIWRAASVKLDPLPRSGADSAEAWLEHSTDIDKAIGGREGIVAGQKKDIVVGPNLTGKSVAIYGWHKQDGTPIQPYSTIHGADFVDYSHGVRLISRNALLDGEEVDLASLFLKPETVALVSDQGMFEPRFPNSGNVAPPPACRDAACGTSATQKPAPTSGFKWFEVTLAVLGIFIGAWGIYEARKRKA